MHARWKLNESQKAEIVTLFRQGWKFLHIARKFKIDHTTVIYHVRKSKAKRDTKAVQIRKSVEPPTCKVPHIWLDDDGSKMNMGKSYHEYLKEDARRKMSQRVSMLQRH